MDTTHCLTGRVFVTSGVFGYLIRQEPQDLVGQYGERVMRTPSKKVTHGMIGTEPEKSKLAELHANNTRLTDEDELFP